MSTQVLSIDNLSKHYGKIRAVDELSLEIEQGNIYGILGPNGSGKTTILGVVLDVINPISGSYKWFGNKPTTADRKRIGAILETPNFYPYLSAVKNLEIIADIKGVSYDEITEVLELVGLTKRKNSRFKTYSLGMKQRLAIAAALLGNPEVLILDEPTNGLDPQGIAEIRNLILEIAQKGLTIIMASHLLDEVQKICTHVAVLKQGRTIFTGEVAEVLQSSTIIEVSGPDLNAINSAIEKCDFVENSNIEGETVLASLKEGHDSMALNKYLIQNDVAISSIALKKKSLENYFLELLAESND
ncbi:MAG: ABC transporter ATP-binding protein [Bacteroidetes bacterium]|nr:ABC transporter ATP-binding protein [Bacteroidota bacterium]